MATIKIDITEYFFKESEIIILKNPECERSYILDIDKIIEDEELLILVHFYCELGDEGGMIRDRKYTSWGDMPISSDDAVDTCKYSKNVRKRIYVKEKQFDSINNITVYKEMII